MDSQRSFLSLSLIEIGAAGAAAFGMWQWLHSFLWNALPFGSEHITNGIPQVGQLTYAGAWTYYGEPIFRQIVIPATLFAALGAIALVRAARQDVRHSSRVGYLALAWPIAGTSLAMVTWTGCCYFWPVGLLLGGLTLVPMLAKRQRDYSGALAIPYNLLWLLWVLGEAAQLSAVYGD